MNIRRAPGVQGPVHGCGSLANRRGRMVAPLLKGHSTHADSARFSSRGRRGIPRPDPGDRLQSGADLARQHHLPRTITEFIEQHHGTTLVEYFYHRASEQKETDPDAADVEENSYRYPGPKPQTRETGVLMLADAVESAAHVLVEPTPARIESLVHEITMKRLLDGQFDECSLDLRQLRTIENSLVKSVTAVYHGRVKYPDQRTA